MTCSICHKPLPTRTRYTHIYGLPEYEPVTVTQYELCESWNGGLVHRACYVQQIERAWREFKETGTFI